MSDPQESSVPASRFPPPPIFHHNQYPLADQAAKWEQFLVQFEAFMDDITQVTAPPDPTSDAALTKKWIKYLAQHLQDRTFNTLHGKILKYRTRSVYKTVLDFMTKKFPPADFVHHSYELFFCQSHLIASFLAVFMNTFHYIRGSWTCSYRTCKQ